MITKLKCKSHKKYKGVRKPTCGCVFCFIRYRFRGKPAKAVRSAPVPVQKNVPTNYQDNIAELEGEVIEK